MKLILDNDELLLGRSHLTLKKNNYIKKYYPTCQVEPGTALFRDNHERIKFATGLMKVAHPELYVGEEETYNFYCVTQNYIDYILSVEYSYSHNVKSYLQLLEKLGYEYSKRDMQHYNLIYRKRDQKPFCIDWEDYVTLSSIEDAYNWYKNELTGLKWLDQYNITKQEATDIFEKEWEKCSKELFG